MYFLYTIDELDLEPIMLIDKHIGNIDGDMGIMGDQFSRELLALDGMGKRRIKVYINSIGGVVVDAMQIYSTINECKTPVDTYNMGIAASAAGLIHQAGRKRYMNDYALLMVHDPFNPDGEDDTELTSKFKDSVLTMLSAKCNKPEAEISAMMAKETWLTASECMSMGFCDEIQASKTSVNLKEYSTIQNKWAAAGKVLNTAIDKSKKTSKMNKVLNFLNLNEAAHEDAVLEAVKTLKTQAEEAVLNAQNAVNELATLKAEKEALEAKITELEASEAAAKDAALTVEAEAVVNTYKNRIGDKAEALTKWVNLYKADAEGTKELLEALPLNVKAPNTEAITHTATAQYNMAYEMAKRANNTKK